MGPCHLGSREQKRGPGLRFAARLLGRPSGRAERSALGAPARCICRSGRTLTVEHSQQTQQTQQEVNRLTSPRASRFSDRYLQLAAHTGQSSGSVVLRSPYGTCLPSCPAWGCYHHHHQLLICAFAFLCCFPFLTTRFSSCPVNCGCPSLALSLALEPAVLLPLRDVVWSKQETLLPSLSVLSLLLMAASAPAPG